MEIIAALIGAAIAWYVARGEGTRQHKRGVYAAYYASLQSLWQAAKTDIQFQPEPASRQILSGEIPSMAELNQQAAAVRFLAPYPVNQEVYMTAQFVFEHHLNQRAGRLSAADSIRLQARMNRLRVAMHADLTIWGSLGSYYALRTEDKRTKNLLEFAKTAEQNPQVRLVAGLNQPSPPLHLRIYWKLRNRWRSRETSKSPETKS